MSDPHLPEFEDDDLDGAEGPPPGGPAGEQPAGDAPDGDEGSRPAASARPSRKAPAHRPGNGNGKHAAGLPDELAGFDFDPFDPFAAGEYENPEETGLPDLEGGWIEGEAQFDADTAGGFSAPDFIERAAQVVHRRSVQHAGRSFTSGQTETGEAGRGTLRLPPQLESRIDPRLCSAGMLEEIEFMQNLVYAAALASSEDDAAALVAAMVPCAMRLAPGFTRGLWPAAPALIAGVETLARLFYNARVQSEREDTARYMALIPSVLVETVARLARISAQHGPVARQAPQVLAEQVIDTLRTMEPPGRKQPGKPPSGARRRRRGGTVSDEV
jgi:hypothetical protein